VTATPVPSPVASGASGAVFADADKLLTGLGLMLVFGLLAMVVVLTFIYFAKDLEFDTVKFLARRGMASTPRDISATIPAVAPSRTAQGQPQINVTGPDRMVVGEPAAYSAAEDGGKKATVTWSFAPSDAAKVEPMTGAMTKVTASKPGPLAIIATKAGSQSSAVLAVMAENPLPAMTVLGSIGAGWGSIIVCIVVAAVVAALGIAGVLDGQAIAGIYGAIIGYLFGSRLQASGSSGTGEASTTTER
jgi:hypothetical protein